MANLVLVDDYVLLRKGRAGLISAFGETVLFEADNGEDFIAQLDPQSLPELVLMDINMTVPDCDDTCLRLKINYPSVKVLALSMYDGEKAIIRMLQWFYLKRF